MANTNLKLFCEEDPERAVVLMDSLMELYLDATDGATTLNGIQAAIDGLIRKGFYPQELVELFDFGNDDAKETMR